MNILLFGADGQLGYELQRSLMALGNLTLAQLNSHEDHAYPCVEADFTKIDEIESLIAKVQPDIIVNAAAYTAVDQAESEHELAYLVNAHAVAAIAQGAKKHGALLVHYSTDYVFSGDASQAYQPTDTPSPKSVYGASKLAGERALIDSQCHYLIFRTAWVYGRYGKNFLNTMLSLAKNKDTLNVVSDQWGTPTWSRWLASATSHCLYQLIQSNPTDVTRALETKCSSIGEVFHISSSGQTNWYEFATCIFDMASQKNIISQKPRVIPVDTSQYPTVAHRPTYSVLDNFSVSQKFTLQIPTWKTCLSLCLDDYVQ